MKEIKGNDLEFNGEKININVTNTDPGLIVEGENITFKRVVFDIEFLSISPDDERRFVGIVCRNCKKITFEKCVMIMRFRINPGKVIRSDFPLEYDEKYLIDKSEEKPDTFLGCSVSDNCSDVVIEMIVDMRKTLSPDLIIRQILDTDNAYQLLINDVPIGTPYYRNTN